MNKRPTRLQLSALEDRAVPTTFTVNTLVDENDGIGVGGISLRDAIVAANADATAGPHIINFSVTGTINLSNNHILINCPQGLTISGPGVGSLTVSGISGTAGANNRIFDINVAAGDPTITVKGMTLTGGNLTSGNNGGAIRINNDPVVIDSVTFNSNKTASAGGAIASTTSVAANLSITNSTFTANTSATTGGAINGTSSINLNITNTAFGSNTATTTGGAINLASSATVTINSSTFTANKGTTGGAINAASTISLDVLTGTSFGSNTSSSNGGAMHIASSATVKLNNTSFTNNSGGGNGGAISNGGTATWTIADSTFTGNQGPAGGVFRFAGTATVSIDRSTVSGNTSTTGVGGGIYFVSGGSLSLTNSTVSGNTATTAGGGLSVATTATTITNSTISGNIANSSTLGGGGISLSTGALTINNSTITKNSAPGGTASGGGIRKTGTTGAFTLSSTIVADNTATTGGADIHNSTTLTLNVLGGDNLVGVSDVGSFTLAGTNKTGTAVTPLNPLLDGLANNGGPTLTHKLLSGSKAFNNGNNSLALSFDQRGTGFPRLNGSKADIGAFEGITFDPAAKATLPNVVTPSSVYIVTVEYTDETAIDTSSIDINDVTLSGPGFGSPAVPDKASFTGSGKTVTATYEFTPPGGAWDFLDDGPYSLDMVAGQVLDTDGPNSVAAGTLGTFNVSVAGPGVVDNIDDIDDGNYGTGQLTLREAINLANKAVGTTNSISFDASLTGMTITVGSALVITDPIQITGIGAANLTISGGGSSRIFDLNIAGVGGNVSISNLTVTSGNATSGTGGAITLVDESLTLNGMVLTANSITGTGGAIGSTGAATLTIGNSTFSSNSASSSGGAINTAGPSLITINKSLFNSNMSNSTGGAIQTTSTVTLDVVDSSFTNNQGTTGGALRFNNGATTVTINRSTLSGNTATSGQGGGLYFNLGGSLEVKYSTFSGNTATTSGGAITIWSGTGTITNSTISGNTANGTGTNGGGGISISSSGSLTLNNSTVTNNSAAGGTGGGIRDSSASGTTTISSCIVAGNTSASGGPDIGFTPTTTLNVDGGDNLIGVADAGGFTLTGTNKTGTSVTPLDPMLETLANYGGSTETHKLKAGSPAINSGNNALGLSFDQRGTGFPRQNVLVDIGSFEGITTIPAAKATAPNVPPILGTITVTVDYYDDVAINTGSIDTGDIRLTGLAFASPAVPTNAMSSGSGTKVTATYTFNPPPGGWQWYHNGNYSIELQSGQVLDTDGPNAVPSGPIGGFTVKIALANPIVVDSVNDTDDGDYSPGNLTLREAINVTNAELGGNTITFAGALNGQTISVGSVMKITDPVTVIGPGAVNLAVSGGGATRIFDVNVTGTGGNVSLSGLTLTGGNATTGTGGAISVADESLTLNGMKFDSNSITGTGGAIGATGAATLNIGSSTFSSNTSSSSGGAINTASSSVITINKSVFNNNTSSSTGGAIQTSSTITLDIADSSFTGNQGTTGGALRFGSSATTVTINRSTVSGNTAMTGRGGGLYFNLAGSLEVKYSTFSGNTAATDGGGITIWSGSATITNSTISDNTANGTGTAGGGGISISSSGSLTLHNSTVTGNTAASGVGGGIRKSSATGTLTIVSSIVAANTSTGGPDINCPTGTPTAIGGVGFNLIGIADLGNFTLPGTNQTGTSASPLDPMLNPLGNNGGPTQTQSIKAGSPALDNGDNSSLSLTNDQRGTGFPRTISGTPDIGAFEAPAQPIPTAKGSATNIDAPGGSTFTVTVTFRDDVGVDISTIDVNDVVVKRAFTGTTLNAKSFVATPNSGVATPVSVVFTFDAPGGTWDAADTDLYTASLVGTVSDANSPTPNNVVAPAKLASFFARLGAKSMVVDSIGDIDDGDYTTGNLTLREAVDFSNGNVGNGDSITFNLTLGSTITLATELKMTDGASITGPGSSKLTISGGDNTRIFNLTDGAATHANFTMSGLKLTGGKAAGDGGAINDADENLTLSDMNITGNTASGAAADGGGINVDGNGATLTVTKSSFTNNSAGSSGDADGGAINVEGSATVTISGCNIDSNTAFDDGGGLLFFHTVTTGRTVLIENSSITNNKTTGGTGAYGGGINFGGQFDSLVIRNSTLSGNSTTAEGGGMQFYNVDSLTVIQNTTIAYNSAATKGGGINQYSVTADSQSANGLISLESSIVAVNTAGTLGPDMQGSKGFVEATNCLFGDITAVTNYTDKGNSSTGLDPLLAPLGNNGGTTLTHPLYFGSPAIDKGTNPASLSFDQRGTGFPRTLNGTPDIGAFEGINVIPLAKATAPNVPPALSTVTVTVVYTDETGIDTSKIDINDITLSGKGFGSPATPTSAMFTGSGQMVTATYVFNPPAGGWNPTHNDTYTINMVAGQVTDTDGPNAVPAGTIGSFKVAIPLLLTVDTAVDEDDFDYSKGDLSLREAIRLVNEGTGELSAISFDPAVFSAAQTITLSLGEMKISQPVSIVGPGANRLTIDGNNASRIFSIDNGVTAKMDVAISGMRLTKGQSSGSISSVTSGGGAIYINSESVTLDGMELDNNISASFGGAIMSNSGSTLLITDSSLHHNTANGGDTTQGGGAIQLMFLSSGSMIIRNSTLAFNTAGAMTTSSVGGAIIGYSGVPNLVIENCTITQNTAHQAGGVRSFSASDGNVRVRSSIISGNTGLTSQPDLQTGGSTPWTITNSLIGSTDGVGSSVTMDGYTTANIGYAVQLGPIQNNGGPTSTMALLKTNTQGINEGANPSALTTDQRGLKRDVGQVDIGAYELQPPRVAAVVINDGGVQRSLVKTIRVSFSEPVTFPSGIAAAFDVSRYAKATPNGSGLLGSVALDIVQSGNDYIITFKNGGTVGVNPGNSLEDGQYKLTINADNVSGEGGTLDGDNDYLAEGSPTDNSVTAFHRLYGDGNGDGNVTSTDFAMFRSVFGVVGPVFDYDDNGVVNSNDFAEFRKRFGLGGYLP